jgi:hypothetical protein
VSHCAFKQRESVVLSRHSLHLDGDCMELHHQDTTYSKNCVSVEPEYGISES